MADGVVTELQCSVAMPQAMLHRWAEMPARELAPGVERRFLTASRVTVARFTLARGAVVPSHTHENEQVSYIVSGAVRFQVGDESFVVRGGETIQIPPNVTHSVETLEDSEAIDIFSPVRQDWLDGTDTYFKR